MASGTVALRWFVKEGTIAVCKVTLLPTNVVVETQQGALLHDVIAQAGQQVVLPCGGQGRCGRCVVLVRQGAVRRRSTVRLDPSEVAQGYALACQTLVESDTTVEIPPQELVLKRPEGAAGAGKAAPMDVVCDHVRAPWVAKYHLRIAPPSLEDNTADWERLRRELASVAGLEELSANLPVLHGLARALRGAQWDVTAVVERGRWDSKNATARLLDVRSGDTTATILGLAIDIGTTSVVVYLADLASGKLLERASAYNGQIACGEDVISRIIYARRPGGLRHLQSLAVQTINGLVDEVLSRRKLRPEDVYVVTVAGNTTMTQLFLGLDPQHIRLEPYIPTIGQPLPVLAGELGLHVHPQASVDCLPAVGAYVGGDITAGVLRTGMSESETVSLFIDVGTNGEIVLGNADWLISCACSAGPAFEGAGVVSGMRATTGAIEEVWINPHTVEPTYRTIGGTAPRGICGSGMIALLGEMFMTGIIDKGGRLNRSLATRRVRVGQDGAEYVVAWASECEGMLRDLVITETDIQNLIRAKAAIYAGIAVLVGSVGLQLGDIEHVLIGGAFGQYIDVEKAIQVGLLPDMPWERFSYLGNTSVQGALLCLMCREERAKVAEIACKMTYLELSADNRFMDAFTQALFLPHTDVDSFPSVVHPKGIS